MVFIEGKMRNTETERVLRGKADVGLMKMMWAVDKIPITSVSICCFVSSTQWQAATVRDPPLTDNDKRGKLSFHSCKWHVH